MLFDLNKEEAEWRERCNAVHEVRHEEEMEKVMEEEEEEEEEKRK